jgi:anhydro-N-acetylmuramic acid kinase
MSVAYDFRSADVAAGGQGAPLVPVFHRALAAPLPKPLAILNLGGVGNVTWLGPDGEMLAFDTGPANGPLDDWARQHTGKDYDAAGKLALAGQADGAVLGRLLAHPYLAAPPPKSLDRLDFDRALREAGAGSLSPRMVRRPWWLSLPCAWPPRRGISRNRRCNGWWRAAGGAILR